MIKIHTKVKTPIGEGILIKIDTPFNGLYVEYDNTTCVVWFGTQNAAGGDGGLWVSREFRYKDIVELNKDRIRIDKIDEINS